MEYKTKPPVILFRPDQQNEDEHRVALDMPQGLPVATSRVGLADRTVIGRYSVLPYYAELEEDLKNQGSVLANTLAQHRYIADFAWYKDLEALTPRTWFDLVSLPKDGGPWVVKGLTNSRKFEWNTMMYAATYQDVLRIARDLGQDGLIGNQGLVIREYTPLNVLEYGLNGLPFANEWRFFFWGETNLAYGFYWTATDKRGKIGSTGIRLAMDAAEIVAQHAQFFVIDVAETADGRWVVIEVNDGQMSGLSDISPENLYKGLAYAVGKDQEAREREARSMGGSCFRGRP